MIFEGNSSYLIRNMDLNGLSRYNHSNLTNGDFTILSKFKPNFNADIKLTGSHTGYVVCKNGMHIGIYFTKTTNEFGDLYEMGCAYCTEYDGITSFHYLKIQINDTLDNYNVGMIHNSDNKTITLYVNGETKTEDYKGNLIDYSNSWLWVGAACGVDGYDERYSYFFEGELNYVGIFRKAFSIKETDEIIEAGRIVDYNSQYWPILITNFKEKTDYKIKDQSNNGNHLILYNNEWI
jgi:hypothetical protein